MNLPKGKSKLQNVQYIFPTMKIGGPGAFWTPDFAQKGNKKPNRTFFSFPVPLPLFPLFGGYAMYRSKGVCGVPAYYPLRSLRQSWFPLE